MNILNKLKKDKGLSQFKKKESGFTIIEVMIVLAIMGAGIAAGLHQKKLNDNKLLAKAVAEQATELSGALQKYMDDNQLTLLTAASGRTPVTVAELVTAKLLPDNYKNKTPFGGTVNMEIVRIDGAKPRLQSLLTTTPWTQDGVATSTPNYELLGAAVREIGAQGGNTFYSGSKAIGLNRTWSLDAGTGSGQFSIITAPGQLVVRSYSDASGLDATYLRRDGRDPMLGNLDMGFHNINNATNISSNGWIYGNHIAANDATIGNLYTVSIRNAGSIETEQITGLGDSSMATFNYLKARTDLSTTTLNNQPESAPVITVGNTAGDGSLTKGKGILNVQDIYLRDGRGIGSYLSDRLPRYVSKGAYFLPVLPPNIPVDASTLAIPGVSKSIIDNPENLGDHNYRCEYGKTRNVIAGEPGTSIANGREITPKGKIELVPGIYSHKTYIDFTDTLLMNNPTTNQVTGTINANVETTPLHVYAEPFIKSGTEPNAWIIRGGERLPTGVSLTAANANTYLEKSYVLVQVFCDYYQPLLPN